MTENKEIASAPKEPKEPKEPQERIVVTEHSLVVGPSAVSTPASSGSIAKMPAKNPMTIRP